MRAHRSGPSALGALALAALTLTLGACDVNERRAADIDVYTTEFDFTPSSATLNGSVLSQQYDVPAIEPSVVDVGAVLLYYREQNSWTAMPYTYAVDDPAQKAVSYTISLGYAFEDRFLEVFYEASTDAVNLRQQPARRIKLVVLGPDLAGKRGVDYTDYAEVKAAFGLKD